MHRRVTVFLLFLLFSSAFDGFYLKAQVFDGESAVSRLKEASSIRIHPETGSIQFAEIREDILIQTDQIQAFLRKVYKLDDSYAFAEIRKEEDELGFLHIRYQILHKGNPVLASVLIVHIKDKRLYSFNGDVYKVTNTEGSKTLSEEACLKIALDTVHAEQYLWQVPEEEAVIKEIKEDEHATWYPKGELVYVAEDLQFNSGNIYLTYKFNIHAFTPRTAENVYIRVSDGKLIARENQLHTTDVPGKAQTKYSGLKNIVTDSTAPFNYRLRENSRGNGVYTFNMKKGTNYGLASDFLDSNNIWNNVNANKDEVATDAHWGAETTFDYYKSKFNRNSYNNNNARINSYVHYAVNYDNAFWDGLRMTYGDGNSFKPLTSLDVCGHEITHAVTSNSANLIYSYQSGQLNESFSDIFGNAIERYGKPSGYSWKIGEEITASGAGLRNMSDPRLNGHPRCYLGTYWYTGAGDNGGVHLNSGVQNWWFYLISEGGSGNNDFSNAYKVDSLGILTAEKIAYRNLTVYLTPNSQFADARFYSIQAAKDLYGSCSKEVISVTNAWYACNVGPKYDSGYVKAAFTADTVVCASSKSVQFYNLSSNAVSSKWYFGDGNTSTVYSPAHTYSAYGNFTIKLVVSSCFKNNKDSITKTAYVKIDSTFDICNAVLMPVSGTDSTHKCQSWIYDDGGEDIYKQQRVSMLRISTPGADSIRIKFYDFDYELNYDSLYIYRGKYPGGVKIGGYTGSLKPNAGNTITVAGSMVTLRHISDPYVVGRGFKLYYTAVKKPVKVTAYSDTSICFGNSTLLFAKGNGGYAADYRFEWQTLANNDSVVVQPLSTTTYKVTLKDVCTGGKDSSNATVTVLNPLEVNVNHDTIICSGRSVNLIASGNGGKTSSYVYTWDNGLGVGNSKFVSPLNTTTYRVILGDGCTPVSDTAFITVYVKPALKLKLSSNDTVICYNKFSTINASGSGGDTMNYMYNWSNGGMGTTQMINLISSTWIKAGLSDGCSVLPAVDSIYIVVRPQLNVTVNKDTTLCYGNSEKLIANVSGGDVGNYEFSWNPLSQDTAIITVQPKISTQYIVTINDYCSNPDSDTVMVNVLAPITVGGLKDSSICYGMSVPLNPVVSGGKPLSYSYTWNYGLSSLPNQLVAPTGNVVYRVIVTDGCSVFGDTAFAAIDVSGPLNATLSSNDTLICYNTGSLINVSGTGGDPSAYVFNWSNGLGSGSSKTITLQNSSWIKVTLSDACTVQPDTDSLYVQVRPELKVDLPSDTLICFGTSVTLQANASGGDASQYTYLWNQSLAQQSSHNLSPSSQTFYKVVLQDNCSADASDSVIIDVRAPLQISNMRDTLICSGGTAAFKPMISGGIPGQYMYTWDNGLSAIKDQSVNPNSNTTYKLIVSDNCSVPYDSVLVQVNVRAPLKLNATLSKSSICSGDSSILQLNFNGGISSQYVWNINSIPSILMNSSMKPVNTTNYIVDLSDNCSQPVADTIRLIVNPSPVVDFTASKLVACRDEEILFTNLSSGGLVYYWNFNGQDSFSATNPLYAYKKAGIYDVSLRAESDSGCTAYLKKTAFMDVVELPIARYYYLPQQPDFLKRDVSFTNQSINMSSFEWDFGDISKDVSNPNPVHNYPDTGHYFLRLIVKNSIGCADTASEWLWVKDVFKVYIPDAISMNNDNINDSFIVLGRGIQTYNLKVFNRWGEMVYNAPMGAKPFVGRDQNGDPLIKGTYVVYLTVRDFEGFMHYIRQVVEIL